MSPEQRHAKRMKLELEMQELQKKVLDVQMELKTLDGGDGESRGAGTAASADSGSQGGTNNGRT